MGNRMMCATTLKTGVAQGSANDVSGGCATTPPLKGGVGGSACATFGRCGGAIVIASIGPNAPKSVWACNRGWNSFSLPKKNPGGLLMARASKEARHPSNAALIAVEKAKPQGIGVDGWPI